MAFTSLVLIQICDNHTKLVFFARNVINLTKIKQYENEKTGNWRYVLTPPSQEAYMALELPPVDTMVFILNKKDRTHP